MGLEDSRSPAAELPRVRREQATSRVRREQAAPRVRREQAASKLGVLGGN